MVKLLTAMPTQTIILVLLFSGCYFREKDILIVEQGVLHPILPSIQL